MSTAPNPQDQSSHASIPPSRWSASCPPPHLPTCSPALRPPRPPPLHPPAAPPRHPPWSSPHPHHAEAPEPLAPSSHRSLQFREPAELPPPAPRFHRFAAAPF